MRARGAAIAVSVLQPDWLPAGCRALRSNRELSRHRWRTERSGAESPKRPADSLTDRQRRLYSRPARSMVYDRLFTGGRRRVARARLVAETAMRTHSRRSGGGAASANAASGLAVVNRFDLLCCCRFTFFNHSTPQSVLHGPYSISFTYPVSTEINVKNLSV